MTYKSAVAGLNLGGGKAVVIGDSRKGKGEAMLRRLGKFINNLGGKYIAAEDVGMSERDMEYIRMETPYVTGLPEYLGGTGDPSPVTAYGVYMGIKAAMKKQSGSDSLYGKRVLVQGVGTVGSTLVDLLTKEGAKVSIFDIHEPAIQDVVKRTGADVISENEVYSLPVDVYAPCALGGTLNPRTIPTLNCSIVAGAANNQLLDEQRDGQALFDRGILYAPDFVINAGGIINITQELEGRGYSRERALKQTQKIYDTTLKIFEKAEKENLLVQSAATEVAKDRIRAIGNNMLSR
jgi:leucine dehydrogenase